MKRILSLAGCLILLAACQTNTTSTPTAPATSATPAQTSVAATKTELPPPKPAEKTVRAVHEITKPTRMEDNTVQSDKAGEGLLLVKNGTELDAFRMTLEKSAPAPAVIAQDGILRLYDSTIRTVAENADGAWLSGPKSQLFLDQVKIRTDKENSPGVTVVDSATLEASQIDILTKGTQSPAVRAAREGLCMVSGGKVKTTGSDSPLILVESDVRISELTGESNSEVIRILGKNSLHMIGCDLTTSAPSGIRILSPGRDETSSLTVQNSKFHLSEGASLIALERTKAKVRFEKSTLPTENVLVRLSESELTLSGIDQEFKGDLRFDNASILQITLTQGSHWEGRLDGLNAKALRLSLDAESKLVLTGDSHVTSLANGDKSCDNIRSNGFNLSYEPTDEANRWLGGQRIKLTGGGYLEPRP